MKYVILADSKSPNNFEIPRQLTKINGEPIIQRTIRLLKENGIDDIIVTSHDSRFDNLGAIRYEPLYNDWDHINKMGYWLSAFPVELLDEPITFLFGDVYYSENAIKKIVDAKPKDNLFFCTYNNNDKRYIKHHDEPLAYKVIKPNVFKAHIEQVKRLKDEGLCCREPIVWELYRSLNGQDINTHTMTSNYVAINDESCDIDSVNDIILLEEKLGGDNMIKARAIKNFTLKDFDKIKILERHGRNEHGWVNADDVLECDEAMADYLTGKNALNEVVVEIIEVIPEIKEELKVESTIKFSEEKPKELKAKFKIEKPKKEKKISKK